MTTNTEAGRFIADCVISGRSRWSGRLFNLLMKYMRWDAGRDTMIAARLFEYTDDDIAASFKDGSKVLLDTLIKLPCIFMHVKS